MLQIWFNCCLYVSHVCWNKLSSQRQQAIKSTWRIKVGVYQRKENHECLSSQTVIEKSQTIVLLSFAYTTIGNSRSDRGVNNTGRYSTFRSRTWSVLGAFMILVFCKRTKCSYSRYIYMYRKPILGKKISILKHGSPTFRYQVLITIFVLIHLFCFLWVGSGGANFTWEKTARDMDRLGESSTKK